MSYKWTLQQEERMRQLLARGVPYLDIANDLGKSKVGVYQKARKMGLRATSKHYTAWSAEERATLRRESLAGVPLSAIARDLGRPLGGVYKMWVSFGRQQKAAPPWTDDETQELRRLATSEHVPSQDEVSKALPKRTIRAIKRRAKTLGLAFVCEDAKPKKKSYWTREELRDAKALHERGVKATIIAKRLGHSPTAVYSYIRNGFKPKYNTERYYDFEWSHRVAEMAKQGTPSRQIADILGVDIQKVYHTLQRQGCAGINNTTEPSPGWTTADNRQLRALAKQGCNITYVAKQMGRNADTIRRHAKGLALPFLKGRFIKPDNDTHTDPHTNQDTTQQQ